MHEELCEWRDWQGVPDDDGWVDEDAGWEEESDNFSVAEVLPAVEEPPMHPAKRRLLELNQKHNVSVEQIDMLLSNDAFSMLQLKFLLAHGAALCRSLQRVYRQHLSLVPARVGPEVQQRFLCACAGQEKISGQLRPAFHGTRHQNIPSILKNGLLIPGQGNSLRVVNGSVHGVGIYTGQLGYCGASLSHGFSHGGPMFICGVIDDAQPVQQYALGIRSVSAESEHVRHVGNAMVIFESRRVAPLFVAVPGSGRWCAESFAPVAPKKPMVIVDFNWTRHKRIVARVRKEYPEHRSFHYRRLRGDWCGPRSRRCQDLKDSCKFLNRRAARKRRPKLS
jgi:hypothetical protein